MPTVVLTLNDADWRTLYGRSQDRLRLAQHRGVKLAFGPQPLGSITSVCSAINDLPVRLFPILGFAITDIPQTDLINTLDLLQQNEALKTTFVPERFGLIAPVGGFQRLDVLSTVNWHHSMVGIDNLQTMGLSGNGVLVGVLDSGVDLKNTPQLDGCIVDSVTFDDHGMEVTVPMSDGLGHGTHVCGIIAGKSIGVAPQCRIALARVAADGRTTFPQMLAGLEWLCRKFPQMQLINMSMGKIEDPTPELKTLVRRLWSLGKLLVCAIGNDGEGCTSTPGNLEDVIGVGAVDMDKLVATFSGGGRVDDVAGGHIKPDLVMPGVQIPSCVPGGRIMVGSGTSMATPMLTGLAALALEADPKINIAALRQALVGSCINLPAPQERDGSGLPESNRLLGGLPRKTSGG